MIAELMSVAEQHTAMGLTTEPRGASAWPTVWPTDLRPSSNSSAALRIFARELWWLITYELGMTRSQVGIDPHTPAVGWSVWMQYQYQPAANVILVPLADTARAHMWPLMAHELFHSLVRACRAVLKNTRGLEPKPGSFDAMLVPGISRCEELLKQRRRMRSLLEALYDYRATMDEHARMMGRQAEEMLVDAGAIVVIGRPYFDASIEFMGDGGNVSTYGRRGGERDKMMEKIVGRSEHPPTLLRLVAMEIGLRALGWIDRAPLYGRIRERVRGSLMGEMIDELHGRAEDVASVYLALDGWIPEASSDSTLTRAGVRERAVLWSSKRDGGPMQMFDLVSIAGQA